MATKKCANGHLYDPSIYGENCPFCPSQTKSTKVNTSYDGEGTVVLDNDTSGRTRPVGGDTQKTVPMFESDGGGQTVIRHVGGNATGHTGISENRRLVGLLVSYSDKPEGEVYKVYEGRTTIGRDRTCDIPFPGDSHMSSKHLLIQYVEAKGAFRAQEYDKGSANGTYVNGKVYVLGDVIDLKNNDIIIVGGTKFIFIAIPEF